MCNVGELQNCETEPLLQESALPKRKHSYHYLSGILTLIFLPHLLFLTIPSLIFSAESKNMFEKGQTSLSVYFANKARRFIIASWLITVALIVLFILFEVLVYYCL